MNNIAEDIKFIALDALTILSDSLKSCYMIINYSDISSHKMVDGKVDLSVVEKELKRFDIESHIGARHKSLGLDAFRTEVVKPAVIQIADGINSLKGDYDFVRMPYDTDNIYCSVEDDGICITAFYGYSMKFMVSTLCFSTVLIKSEDI